MNSPLYTPAILRLAASIPYETRLPAPHATTEKRSPVCGGRIVVDVALDEAGRIAELGMDVHGCALGQASAALMGAHAIGRDAADLAAARDALAGYLAGTRDDPGDWPGLDIFAPARTHRGRHAAILLPFEAASVATLSLTFGDVAA